MELARLFELVLCTVKLWMGKHCGSVLMVLWSRSAREEVVYVGRDIGRKFEYARVVDDG